MTSKNRQRRTYTEEFKREAVALVTEHGYNFSEAGASLDVGANLIRKWKKQYEETKVPGALTKNEREELIRLRKENRELKLEQEILKKASAYFAKQMK